VKIIAMEIEREDAAAADFAPHLRSEARRLWELQQQGFVREAYFRADRHTAVLILECESTEHAELLISSLPLVQHHLIDFDIIPLAPYSGFERLFA
jgi:muconolactone delta-isomerase